MRANIKRKVYDTESSKLLNSKSVGEFGDTCGYEEKVYQTNRGLYFNYGVGGPDSPYPKETIKPITQEEAGAGENESGTVKKSRAKKAVQDKKGKEPKAKTPRKPSTKKAAKDEAAEQAEEQKE